MFFRFFLLSFLLPLASLSAAAVDVRFLAWDEDIATRKLAVAGLDITNLHPLARTADYKMTVEEGT